MKAAGPILVVEDLSFSFGKRPVLAGLNFTVPTGGITGIIGPNGSGKTTLLKCLNKTLTPTGGRVTFMGQDLSRIKLRTLARLMGVVPQQWTTPFAFTVREVVMMGRFPYLRRWAGESEADRAVVREAMQATNTWALADRLITELSGGERQRVLIAQALAQTPRLLLLDEPTSHLDVNQTLEICALLERLIRTKGLTVLAVFHDLNLAARYCQQLIMLKEGYIYAQGAPEEVLSGPNVDAVFGVKTVVGAEPFTGRPYLYFFLNQGQ
ncbi:MAG: ABC transporter ATP-binding protein [Firmicutes bacterium]|nr:ABC transporter ATP-binding protein [Bacillota bacterium]